MKIDLSAGVMPIFWSGFSDRASFSLKGWSGALAGSARFYAEFFRGSLGTASRLHEDQADYLRKLSQATQPGEVLAVNGEFMRKFVSSIIEVAKSAPVASDGAATPRDNVSTEVANTN